MPFSFTRLPLDGLVLVEPAVFGDDRGFFMETYKSSQFEAAGITARFVQDNHSRSGKGVVRGLHFQKGPHAQAKLVRVSAGSVWDVAVDLRHGSVTYGKWFALELSAANAKQLFIPEGFAHGFQSLQEGTELQYKCGAEYHPQADSGIRWDDPELALPWPIEVTGISPKDAALPLLCDVEARG